MSEFTFSCPQCGQHIQGNELWSGRQINCPSCQQPLVVPSLGPPTAQATPRLPPPVPAPSLQAMQGSSGKNAKYRRYEDVPWYRRSTLNHIFALSGLLCFPPFVWWVVTMCLTGNIYQKNRDKEGNLKTWGMFSKVFSVLLVVGQVALLGRFMAGSAKGVARGGYRAQSIMCESNLKQIGLAFKLWALDHNDQFPFNVSTKAGGSRESCARGSDGFDQNATLHFRVLSKELWNPKVLACPADAAKRPASDFTALAAINVSYQLRSGTNVSDAMPNEVLAVCPIHKHVLRCSGFVERGTAVAQRQ